jgi:hypothetical protein
VPRIARFIGVDWMLRSKPRVMRRSFSNVALPFIAHGETQQVGTI